jgi:hypothetical protein
MLDFFLFLSNQNQELMADYQFYSWSQDGHKPPSMPSGYALVIQNHSLEQRLLSSTAKESIF